jgi:hypothetical protein
MIYGCIFYGVGVMTRCCIIQQRVLTYRCIMQRGILIEKHGIYLPLYNTAQNHDLLLYNIAGTHNSLLYHTAVSRSVPPYYFENREYLREFEIFLESLPGPLVVLFMDKRIKKSRVTVPLRGNLLPFVSEDSPRHSGNRPGYIQHNWMTSCGNWQPFANGTQISVLPTGLAMPLKRTVKELPLPTTSWHLPGDTDCAVEQLLDGIG